MRRNRVPSQPEGVNHQCVACPPGKTHTAGDIASGPDTSCDAVTCSTNERVQNHACVACPAGTTNDGGDDASQGDTQCDITPVSYTHLRAHETR